MKRTTRLSALLGVAAALLLWGGAELAAPAARGPGSPDPGGPARSLGHRRLPRLLLGLLWRPRHRHGRLLRLAVDGLVGATSDAYPPSRASRSATVSRRT